MWDEIFEFINNQLINANVPTQLTDSVANLLTAFTIILFYYVGVRFVGAIGDAFSSLWKR